MSGTGGKQRDSASLAIDRECDTADVHDGSAFQHVIDNVAGESVVSVDTGSAKKGRLPHHLRLCLLSGIMIKNHFADYDLSLSFQEGDPSQMGRFQEPGRLHFGAIQALGAMSRASTL